MLEPTHDAYATLKARLDRTLTDGYAQMLG